MPYGTRRFTTRARTVIPRRTRAPVQKKARATAVAKARARPIRAIAKNTRTLKKLVNKVRGPLQTQISTYTGGGLHHVLAESPFLFHVNDPGVGTNGPRMWHRNLAQSSVHVFGNNQFEKYTDDGYNEHMNKHMPNAHVYMVGVDLQFQISGFVDNTHVRIDIIRQKKINTDFYNQSNATNYLPQTLGNLKELAGFSANELNRQVFEVISSKKVFLNSRGSSNLLDTSQDRETIRGTTSNVKHCHIYVPINKDLKMLENHLDESWGMDHALANHPYDYTNQNPLQNIWCLISCDDKTQMDSIVTGDAVSVSIIRKCYWRDRMD